MNDAKVATSNHEYMERALNIALRLVFVAVTVLWCFRIVSPFFMP